MNNTYILRTGLIAGMVGALTLGASLSTALAGSHEKMKMDHGKMNHQKMEKKMPAGGGMNKAPVAKTGAISISSPWARKSFGNAVNSAGFMVIENSGSKDDRLIEARSKIAKKTELHTHIRDGQIMRMRRVEGGIPVPKQGNVKLQPGSYHIMFIGLHKPLKQGDSFPLTLKFENAGEVTFTVTARKNSGKMGAGGMMMDHGKMDHSKMKMNHK